MSLAETTVPAQFPDPAQPQSLTRWVSHSMPHPHARLGAPRSDRRCHCSSDLGGSREELIGIMRDEEEFSKWGRRSKQRE